MYFFLPLVFVLWYLYLHRMMVTLIAPHSLHKETIKPTNWPEQWKKLMSWIKGVTDPGSWVASDFWNRFIEQINDRGKMPVWFHKWSISAEYYSIPAIKHIQWVSARGKSSALAIELLLSYTNPSICYMCLHWKCDSKEFNWLFLCFLTSISWSQGTSCILAMWWSIIWEMC